MSVDVDVDDRKKGIEGLVNDACSETTSNNEEEEEEDGDVDEEEDEDVDDGGGKLATLTSMALGAVPANIHMENTSEVQVGPRLLYNAPVTVNQTVHVGTDNGHILQYALKAPLQDIDLNTNNIHGDYSLKTPKENEKRKTFHCNWRWFAIIAACVGILTIVIYLALHFGATDDRNDATTKKPTLFPEVPPDRPIDPNTTLSNGRHIFLKGDWYGQPPKFERKLQHPVPFVVISHTVTQPCYEYKDCAQQMRNMQDTYMAGPFPDLGYSFVVGNDGNVYEARGWDTTNMHSGGFLKWCNIGISLIGNFVHDIPTNGQLNATQELIELGVKLGKIDPNYKLVPMNATFETLSPGKNLYKVIKNWPHFWIPTDKDIGICAFDIS